MYGRSTTGRVLQQDAWSCRPGSASAPAFLNSRLSHEICFTGPVLYLDCKSD